MYVPFAVSCHIPHTAVFTFYRSYTTEEGLHILFRMTTTASSLGIHTTAGV